MLVHGLVKFSPAVAHHFCLNLSAAFSQQCTTNLADLSSLPLQLRQNDTSLPQWLGRDALFPHTETTPSSIKTDAAGKAEENKTGNGGPPFWWCEKRQWHDFARG